MGLKCSLLGHDFGDPELEREREERGDEVVLISREVETCGRCCESRVVTENKEVTTVQPAAAVDDEGDAATDLADVEADTADAGADTADADADTADADADAADAPGRATGLESAIEQVEADEEFDPPQSPEEDDAVILDDDDDDRAPGEWPDDDAVAADAAAAAPDDEAAETDGAASDADDEPGATAIADAGPEPSGSVDGEDAEVWSGGMDDGGDDPDHAGPTITTDAGEEFGVDAASLPDDSLYCPACGFSEPLAGSSLRAGDACPECHGNYLEQTG
ncbi:MAG: hypothetical protein ABEJ06_01900 [Haloarculaceae archaeon]